MTLDCRVLTQSEIDCEWHDDGWVTLDSPEEEPCAHSPEELADLVLRATLNDESYKSRWWSDPHARWVDEDTILLFDVQEGYGHKTITLALFGVKPDTGGD